MIPRSFPSVHISLLLVSALLLGGCSSILPPATQDPTRFYILSPGEAPAANGKTKTVGLRSVELPGYLRSSRSLVVMTGENEVRFADIHRWAEPLDTGISRLVRERLSSLLAPSAVYAPPFPADVEREVDVSIRVIRCEGDPVAQRSVFIATYHLSPAPGKGGSAVMKRYEAPAQPWDGADYAALSKALSASVDGLADQISADLP